MINCDPKEKLLKRKSLSVPIEYVSWLGALVDRAKAE